MIKEDEQCKSISYAFSYLTLTPLSLQLQRRTLYKLTFTKITFSLSSTCYTINTLQHDRLWMMVVIVNLYTITRLNRLQYLWMRENRDGSPYSFMSYTRELYSHAIMQQDVGRTCNIGYTEICGVSPTKNHWEKSRRRCDSLGKKFRGKSWWRFSVRTSYGSSLSMTQEVVL